MKPFQRESFHTRCKHLLYKFGAFLAAIYLFGMFLSFPYFSYEFEKENGFIQWATLGSFVTATKALAWPYFAGEIIMAPQALLDKRH